MTSHNVLFLKGVICLGFLTTTLALRMEYPTPEQIEAVVKQNAQLKSASYIQQHSDFEPGKVVEFAAEAREDHGDQWVDLAMQRLAKKDCDSEMLTGVSEIMPSWTILALKNGGANIGKSTNGVFQDWMRYGNYCGNQMHGTGYGDVKQGEAACSAANGKVTAFEFKQTDCRGRCIGSTLLYDVCDDCGLDSGCALHDSSWVHQAVNDQTTEKGPTMCAANEAFQQRIDAATSTGCTKKFEDGHGVPEQAYMKLAKCAMILAPCINYEGPSLLVLEKVNPALFRQCKTQSGSTKIKFLACVSVHYMNYRVPLGDYGGMKMKCTPEDATCFIQGDARGTDHKEEVGSEDKASDDALESLLESLLEKSSSFSGPRCGPIASPSMSLCRAIARHVVVGDKGKFSIAPDTLVNERPPLASQDLVSLDVEINADPAVRDVMDNQIKPLTPKRDKDSHKYDRTDTVSETAQKCWDGKDPMCPVDPVTSTVCPANGICTRTQLPCICTQMCNHGQEPSVCPAVAFGSDVVVITDTSGCVGGICQRTNQTCICSDTV